MAITFTETPPIEFELQGQKFSVDITIAQERLIALQSKHGRGADFIEAVKAWLAEEYSVTADGGWALAFNNAVMNTGRKLDDDRKKKVDETVDLLIGMGSTHANGQSPTNLPGKETSDLSTPSDSSDLET